MPASTPAAEQSVVDAAARSPQRPSAGPAPRGRWLLRAGVIAFLVAAGAIGTRIARLYFAAPPAMVVTASGRIEGRDVTIAPKDIQGRVTALHVDEGDTVTKGQLLAELEANALEARAATLTAAIANVDAQISQARLDVTLTAKNSDASIAAAEAALSSARAKVERANALSTNARADYERGANLYKEAVISKHEFDQLETALRTGDADAESASKDLTRAQADLAFARVSKDMVAVKREQVRALQHTRRAAVGQLDETQANLAERRIVAPADGTILSRPVEVGDVVSPGSPLFELVDLRRLYVKVYIPEPDIPKLKLGDPADVKIDAFPDRTFPARVSRIHDEAEFTPKNVETTEERLKLVFGVEVVFVNPDRLLKPGMPADVTIHWTAAAPPGTHHES